MARDWGQCHWGILKQCKTVILSEWLGEGWWKGHWGDGEAAAWGHDYASVDIV